MVRLTINGKEIEADDNKTLLEVIKENNIADVPTLCHSELLEPFTSCFLCVAEVEGARSLVPTCATKVRDGMKVNLESERVIESRKMNLELLLSNHNADCFPPCRIKCPANVDIQGYIALANRGLYKEGQMLMRETNALPMVCGRVCARPCEDNCRRRYVDEAVDIKNIKRYMADLDLNNEEIWMPEVGPDTGKKVAVIGSGPAGLAVAYYLRQIGHGATIFERLPKAGGMMRYGIPEYRLPKEDLQKEIDGILKMGVDIKYNYELGKDTTIDGLFDSGFDAVFLGIGAQLGSPMGTKGQDLEGIRQGVDFLLDVNLGKDVKLGGKVFIVGGGNTAIDAARSALRSGADSVGIIYRRTQAEMPAHHEEIEDAVDEGIELLVLNNPVEYIGENGKLTSVKLQKMELGEPDDSGRRRPVPIEGSEYVIEADHVIEAVGQKVDTSCIDNVELSKWNTIDADENLFNTSRKGVFAGGDAVTGPSIIISALAHGRKAANSIDQYLNGVEFELENRLGFHISKEDFGELSAEDFENEPKIPRHHMPKLPADTRKKNFKEVELGFSEEDFLNETKRCMECGCQDIYECKLKDYSEEYNVNKSHFIGGEYKEDKYDAKDDNFLINTEKCINCGLCVRLCSMVQKQSVFTYDQRGFDATPVPYTYRALSETNCISCGTCITGCPVGAIVELPMGGKPGPIKTELTETYCNLCGDGCKIVVETHKGNFIKVSSKIKNQMFFDNLCARGRFGYDKYFSKKPMDTSDKTIAEVKDFIKNADSSKTVLSISPELTIEEIDLSAAFALKNSIDLYSFELSKDIEKLNILKEKNIKLNNKLNKDISGYKNVYYFGLFDEEYNSVSFRKLIRDDDKQNINISADLNGMFFNYNKFNSDMEMLKSLKENISDNTLVTFNLQKIDPDVLKEVADLLSAKGSGDYMVLNCYSNYSYILDKIPGLSAVKDKVDNNRYDTLIMLNGDDNLIQGDYKDIIAFNDMEISKKVSFFVPIDSLYEKSGKIIDQLGETKELVKAAESKSLSLNKFFEK